MRSRSTFRVSHPVRGAGRDRHERAVGCGGRGSCDGRAQAERTAKTCGPDTPTLVSSWREAKFPAGDGGKKARSPGRARYKPVETTAQGKPDCLRWTCMLVCAFFRTDCTRDRGCSAHPAFPAPSSLARAEGDAKLGRIAPREREGMLIRHCEKRSDEAIHSSARGTMDCFAEPVMGDATRRPVVSQ